MIMKNVTTNVYSIYDGATGIVLHQQNYIFSNMTSTFY